MTNQTESKHFQCRHILADGHRCGSKCLRGEQFCYYHHTTRRPAPKHGSCAPQPEMPDTMSRFDLPLPEDRSAIQAAIGIILQRIAGGCLDSKRAGLLLYALQIASSNLPKQAAAPPLTPFESVEEIVLDPDHGPIAPVAEFNPAPPGEKSFYDALMESWYEEEPEKLAVFKAERLAQRYAFPPEGEPEPAHAAASALGTTLPTLQAAAEPGTQIPAFIPRHPRSRLCPCFLHPGSAPVSSLVSQAPFRKDL